MLFRLIKKAYWNIRYCSVIEEVSNTEEVRKWLAECTGKDHVSYELAEELLDFITMSAYKRLRKTNFKIDLDTPSESFVPIMYVDECLESCPDSTVVLNYQQFKRVVNGSFFLRKVAFEELLVHELTHLRQIMDAALRTPKSTGSQYHWIWNGESYFIDMSYKRLFDDLPPWEEQAVREGIFHLIDRGVIPNWRTGIENYNRNIAMLSNML